MKTDKSITSFDDHLDEQYGKKGTLGRQEFEEDFETFRIGVLIQKARKNNSLPNSNSPKKSGLPKAIFPESKTMPAIFD